MQQYVDFYKSDFPALEAKELTDVMTIVRMVEDEYVSAVTAQFMTVMDKFGTYQPFVTLCVISNLRTSEEHRGKGYARNLIQSIAMCLKERAQAR